MSSKVLLLASVASMIDQFNMSNIHILQKLGCEVHVAANFISGNTCSENRLKIFKKELLDMNVIVHNILFPRKIGSIKENYSAYKQVIELLRNNDFSLIHLHSPIGGVIGRLAIKKLNKKKITTIYTAHGFHFFKGAPLSSWIFYPIEFFLSIYTDVLITINKEDFKRACRFYARSIKYIPGVGVDTNKYKNTIIDKIQKRKELGIPQNSFIVLSVGELSKRKNHEVIIKAISLIENKNIHYLICGKGNEEKYLKRLAEQLGLIDRIHFLGFRSDINEIVKLTDCFAFPSKREGLGIAAIEAMSVGLPIITSNINGILDYSENEKTGYTCSPLDIKGFASAISQLCTHPELSIKMRSYNIEVAKKFDIYKVNEKMEKIYKEALNLENS